MATKISKNFTLEEFTGGQPVNGYVEANLRLLARWLQVVRDHFDLPVKIVEGISGRSPEHREGKAAIITIEGKTADQIHAAMEGRVFNGTIGLMAGNQIYYSLSPIGGRWDQRVMNPGPTETPPEYPRTAQKSQAIILGAVALGLFVLAKSTFKTKKK